MCKNDQTPQENNPKVKPENTTLPNGSHAQQQNASQPVPPTGAQQQAGPPNNTQPYRNPYYAPNDTQQNPVPPIGTQQQAGPPNNTQPYRNPYYAPNGAQQNPVPPIGTQQQAGPPNNTQPYRNPYYAPNGTQQNPQQPTGSPNNTQPYRNPYYAPNGTQQNPVPPAGTQQPTGSPPNGTNPPNNTQPKRPFVPNGPPYAPPYRAPQYVASPMYNNYPVPLKEKLKFNLTDGIFAFLYTLLGFLFVKYLFFVNTNLYGLGATICFITLIFLSIVYLGHKKVKFSVKDVILLAVPLIFSLNLAYSAEGLIKFLTVIFLFLYSAYYIYAKGHNVKRIDHYFFYNLLKGSVILPFSYFPSAPKAMTHTIKESKSKRLKWILLGLVIAFPITCIVASLLLSGDIAFQQMFSSVFYDFIRHIPQNIFLYIFGLPLSFLLFAAVYATVTKKGDKVLPKSRVNAVKAKTKVFSPYLFYAVLTPLCILYILFFIAQSSNFLPAFQNLLPQNFSYAEYARQGFFELCVVAAINLTIVWVIIAFCKREEGKMNKATKTYCIIFSLFTILLIITAIRKMVLYMQFYGLTQMRIYTTWFMVLMGAIFLLIILKMFISRLPFQRILSVVFVLLFAVLAFANIDGMIAKYNVERYQKGEIGWMGADTLDSLGDGATPYLLPLYQDENTPQEVKRDCGSYFKRVEYRYHTNVFYSNYTSRSAYRSIQDADVQTYLYHYYR